MENEILKGNKLIAEFMGCNPIFFKNSGGSGYDVKLIGVPDKGYISYSLAEYGSKQKCINKLLTFPFYYHSSWEWLMPAIVKFIKLGNNYTLSFPYDNVEKEFHEFVSILKWWNTQQK